MQRTKKFSSLKNLFSAGVGLLAIFGAALVFYSTVKGLNGFSDPVAYLVSARNLVRGIGIGYYFPDGRLYVSTIGVPLYSIALGAVSYFNIDVLQAARVLDVLFLVASLLSLGVLFYRFGSNPSFVLLVSLTIAVFTPFFGIFISGLTESLFIPLFIGCEICLLVFINRRRTIWLILSAILTGLLTITRYNGIAILVVGIVCLLIFPSDSLLHRLKEAALYGFLGILPLLIWGISIKFHINQPTVGLDIPLSLSILEQRFQQFRLLVVGLIWNWIPFTTKFPFFTYRLRLIVILFIGVVVVGVTLFASRHEHKQSIILTADSDFQIFSIFGLSAIASLVFLVFTFLIFGLPARLDDRQLLPFEISTSICFFAACAFWLKTWFHGNRLVQLVPWMIAGIFIYWFLPGTITLIVQTHQDVSDLAFRWKSSTLIQAVEALPKNTPIVSNGQDLVLLWADRPAYDLFVEMQPGFLDQNTSYGTDLSDRAQTAFSSKSAALVIFGNDQVLAQELENTFGEKGRLRETTLLNGLILAGDYPDGRLYFSSR